MLTRCSFFSYDHLKVRTYVCMLPLKCKSSKNKTSKKIQVLSEIHFENSKKGGEINTLDQPRHTYLLGSVLHLTEQLG